MNKYTIFGIIVVAAVVLDIGTKTIAERTLASQTSEWVHGIEREITEADRGLMARDYVEREFNVDSDDPLEEPALRSLYQLDPAGERPPSPIRPTTILDERHELVELRYRAVNVIDGFWAHSYARNPGAAFGFLSGSAEWLRRPFFIGISIVAVIIIMGLFRRLRDDQYAFIVTMSCIVGGALGNFIDRVRYGYVVDFIDWYATIGGEVKHWPTFNIADVFISVGVVLLSILLLFGDADFLDAPQEGDKAKESPEPQASAE